MTWRYIQVLLLQVKNIQLKATTTIRQNTIEFTFTTILVNSKGTPFCACSNNILTLFRLSLQYTNTLERAEYQNTSIIIRSNILHFNRRLIRSTIRLLRKSTLNYRSHTTIVHRINFSARSSLGSTVADARALKSITPLATKLPSSAMSFSEFMI